MIDSLIKKILKFIPSKDWLLVLLVLNAVATNIKLTDLEKRIVKMEVSCN